ncbi:MAG: HlyD family efflux transporter periplasmic adaptor subunit [Oscillospiraceae bacterium]|nr:HlyD family efflux transporter periplasmic adaptor subunit [Oscillospiraceae bacterium]
MNRQNLSKWLKRPITLWIIGGSLAVILLAELVFGFGLPIAQPQLETLTLKRSELASPSISTGAIEAYERAVLFARADGTVESVFRQTGELVRKGDLLLTLSNPKTVQALQSNDQALEAARAAIRPALIAAEPEVVRAPVTGRVTLLNAQLGGAMDDGALAVIARDGALCVTIADARLAESAGQTVTVESGGAQCEGVVAVADGESYRVSVTNERFEPGQTARVMDASGITIASGILRAEKPAVIFGVSGVINTVHIKQGDWVTEGEPLFTLEGPLSLPGYDEQLRAIESLLRTRNEAQDVVDALSIYASDDGVLIGFDAQPGDTIRAGQALGTLTDPDQRTVILPLDTALSHDIQTGMSIELSIDGVSEPVEAIVESVTTRTDISGSKAYVRAALPYTEDVRVGASTSVSFETGLSEYAIWIPEEAVVYRDGGAYVLRAPAADNLPFSVRRLRGPIGALFHPDAGDIYETLGDELLMPVTLEARPDGWYKLIGGAEEGDVILLRVESTNAAPDMALSSTPPDTIPSPSPVLD